MSTSPLRIAAATAAMVAIAAPAAQARPAIDPAGAVPHREPAALTLDHRGLDWSSAGIGAGLAFAMLAGGLGTVRVRRPRALR